MSDTNAPQRAIPSPLDIRTLRDRLGLSGQAFAERINQQLPGAQTNRQTVYRWESGRRQVSPIYAEAIRRIEKEIQE